MTPFGSVQSSITNTSDPAAGKTATGSTAPLASQDTFLQLLVAQLKTEAVACGDADFTVIAVNLKGENYLAWNFYNDTDVQPGATYAYRVRAFNSAGQSAPSNAASATACFVDTDWEGGGYYICVDP